MSADSMIGQTINHYPRFQGIVTQMNLAEYVG